MLVEEMLCLGENQSMLIKFARLFIAVVVLAFGVFAFDFDGGYGITDCGVKWVECPAARGFSVDLVVVMIEYGCSSVSCVCGFLLNSLNYDFLGVDCLVSSVYEQLGDSETGGALALVFDC